MCNAFRNLGCLGTSPYFPLFFTKGNNVTINAKVTVDEVNQSTISSVNILIPLLVLIGSDCSVDCTLHSTEGVDCTGKETDIIPVCWKFQGKSMFFSDCL